MDAGVIAAFAFVLLVGALCYPIIKLGRLIEEARRTVRGISDGTVPLLSEVTTTVASTNAQLVKVAAFSYGVRQAVRSRSAGAGRRG
jgi:uncharacterized protein YoxC